MPDNAALSKILLEGDFMKTKCCMWCLTKAKVCTSLVGVSVILIRAQCVSGLKFCYGWCREQLRAVSVVQAESKLQEIEDPVIWAFYFWPSWPFWSKTPKKKRWQRTRSLSYNFHRVAQPVATSDIQPRPAQANRKPIFLAGQKPPTQPLPLLPCPNRFAPSGVQSFTCLDCL